MANSTNEIDAAIDDVDEKLNVLSNYLLPNSTGPGMNVDFTGFRTALLAERITLGEVRNASWPFEHTTYVDV